MDVSDVFKIANRENIFIVGISGGIASGKTTVTNEFVHCGAHVINADNIVHEVLQKKETQDKILLSFPSIFPGGIFEKKNLAKEVFSCPDKLKKLESILHPLARLEIKTQLEEFAANGKKVVILDAALLWENGLHKGVDKLVFIDTPIAVRQQRAINNRNWTADELSARERFQMDLDTKKKGSHYIIQNNSDNNHMKQQVLKIWNLFPKTFTQ